MPTILLATDADWILDEVDAALSDGDTTVFRVRAGIDVLQAIDQVAPDLVILDEQIGNMGGIAVAIDLRLEESAGRLDRANILLLLDREADEFIARRADVDLMLVKPVVKASDDEAAAKPSLKAGAVECDEELFARLRGVRKTLADARGVPPYVVFSDATLRYMARLYPTGDAEMLRVPGVGEKKLADFGRDFLAEIASWLESHPRVTFAPLAAAASAAPVRKPRTDGALNDTTRETLALFREGLTNRPMAGYALGMVVLSFFAQVNKGT